jgi:hypothetical protein
LDNGTLLKNDGDEDGDEDGKCITVKMSKKVKKN